MSLDVKITKRFDGFTLRTEFTAGNTTAAILGASGCGKSMTLRCIAGIVRPDNGRIVLDGRVLFDSEQGIDLPPQQRNVGLLFQNYALFPNMTVEQNILCALKKEKDPAARKAACAEALRAMRLEELAHRLPSELSGGQQQRAALARILAGKPRILMLDEPFSALDSYLREEVEGEVGSLLAGFDGTALLVTHNRDEAYRLCREMIVMDGGEVLRAGTTREVFADPRRLTAARLTGCKNILPCVRVDAHRVHLTGWEQELAVALPVPENCTAVGIRAPCPPQRTATTGCQCVWALRARIRSTGTSSAPRWMAAQSCGGRSPKRPFLHPCRRPRPSSGPRRKTSCRWYNEKRKRNRCAFKTQRFLFASRVTSAPSAPVRTGAG